MEKFMKFIPFNPERHEFPAFLTSFIKFSGLQHKQKPGDSILCLLEFSKYPESLKY